MEDIQSAATQEGETPLVTVTNDKLKEDLQQWAKNKRRPLVLVAVGRGGVGKSTLVNNLLGLEKGDEQYCPPGNLARAETKIVKVCKKTKEGAEVHIVDTPGLGASLDDIDPRKVIEELSKQAKDADLLFYCVSLHPGARLDRTDVKIVQLLTKAYGPEVWKRAFLLLTFANHSDPKDYIERVRDYASAFTDVLKKAGVGILVEAKFPNAAPPATVDTEQASQTPQMPPQETSTTAPPNNDQPSATDPKNVPGRKSNDTVQVPAIPVGDKTMKLHIPFEYNWSDVLFTEALKRASDAQTLANLLALRGFKVEIGDVVGGALGGGAIVGGTVGGTAGGIAGLGMGLFIGAPVGAVVGGIGGVILAVVKAKIEKFQAMNF